jgi:hypothetical protein
LGKILRLDVRSAPDPGLPYKIPSTNPFKNTDGARAEIWAFGLRNPWRFGFDRVTGDLFIADVGQNMWEEIDFQPAGSPGGANYGWHILEGAHCYNAATCNPAGLTPPILEYSHTLGCSVTGGYRYRGSGFPALVGVYVFADFCSGRIWGGTPNGNGSWSSSELLDSPYSITAFGEDEAGELYFTHYDSQAPNGAVYRVASNASVTALTPNPNTLAAPVVVNTPVTWTATASNGGAGTLEYRFWAFRNSAWSIVRDYAASNTFQWTPTAAGPYSFGVWVRHVGNPADLEAGLGTASFTITAGPVASLTSLTAGNPGPDPLSGPVPVNTPITWTAVASNGGSGTLEYRFWVFRNGAWSMVRDYAASSTFQWTPTAAGPYSFGVWVRHVGNPADFEAALGTATFQITP